MIRPGLIALLLVTGACLSGTEPTPAPGQLEAAVTKAAHPSALDSTLQQVTETPLVAPQSRSPRRISVKQMRAAIDRIFGFPWEQTESGTTKDMMTELALAFGQPNFMDVTQEDLSTSPLFVKFLNDGARTLCTARTALDMAGVTHLGQTLVHGVGAEDTFESKPALMEAALKRVLLVFWGRRVEGAELARWQQLFEQAAQSGGSSELGWRTVCVAAMTHPWFYSF
jgi:hypothetical protein